ncbi:MAG: Ca-activated chloride channel [Cryptosporangiaceae bacterium]|nr:Ca-activated chloride channel [Cryptosporangiaceae bacterium]
MSGGRHRGELSAPGTSAPPPRSRSESRSGRVRPDGTRSERRAGSGQRRFFIAPWIAVSAAVVLLLSGLSFGYVLLAGRGCSGKPETITVLSSADQAPVMTDLAKKWADTKPHIGGTCIGAVVERKNPSEVAAALGPNWDARRDGARPDVWAPDSNAWLLVAADRADAAAMIPDAPQSLASSAVVIAMPKPMAEALNWPNAPLGWRDLVDKFGGGKSWADVPGGKAEWGGFRVGMTNPATSTAGLHALFAITDFNNDEEVSDEELKTGLVFERTVTTVDQNSGQLFEGLAKADAQGQDAALHYLSAFPALERDVLNYNATNPKVPLAAVYPEEGTADANYPFAILKASWVSKTRQQIAQQFLSYLRSDTGREAYGKAGFRDADRSAKFAAKITSASGFQPKITAPPRAMTLPSSVTRTVVAWTALRRRANVLAVLDTSGSMADPATPSASKLQIVQLAATKAVSLFSSESKVGLWEFATKRTPTTDYRELAPIGSVGGTTNGLPNRLALDKGLQSLKAQGATGLYDTAVAAYKNSEANYEAGRLNIVVLMTDGKNEKNGGLTFQQTLDQLKAAVDPNKPVQIVTIAFGADADVPALQAISRVTGGRTFVSRDPRDIEKVFLAALFGSR